MCVMRGCSTSFLQSEGLASAHCALSAMSSRALAGPLRELRLPSAARVGWECGQSR